MFIVNLKKGHHSLFEPLSTSLGGVDLVSSNINMW